METINDNIRQLLEMLDNPEAYTEQEIQDIINRDEDTREAYRMMVEAKRSSRKHQANKPIDVDAAWQKFNQIILPQQHSFDWMKLAASFIGVLLVSGIAFAAIQIVRYTRQQTPTTEKVINTSKPTNIIPTDTLITDTTTTPQSIIFDNITLEKMLPEIAKNYNIEVEFQNADACQLRFYFVWKQDDSLQEVVEKLNMFEHVNLTIEDNKLIVR